MLEFSLHLLPAIYKVPNPHAMVSAIQLTANLFGLSVLVFGFFTIAQIEAQSRNEDYKKTYDGLVIAIVTEY